MDVDTFETLVDAQVHDLAAMFRASAVSADTAAVAWRETASFERTRGNDGRHADEFAATLHGRAEAFRKAISMLEYVMGGES